MKKKKKKKEHINDFLFGEMQLSSQIIFLIHCDSLNKFTLKINSLFLPSIDGAVWSSTRGCRRLLFRDKMSRETRNKAAGTHTKSIREHL